MKIDLLFRVSSGAIRWLTPGESPKPRLSRSSNRTLGTLERLEPRMLMAAGALDTQFNRTGTATAFFDLGGGKNDFGRATAVDSSGRTLVAGSAQRSNTGDFDFAVTRFRADGSLDTSFGSGGKRTIPFDLGGGNTDIATAIAIDSSGRIILAGRVSRSNNGDSDFGVTRLTSSGNLDTTFGSGGKRTVAFDLGGSNYDEAASVVIDSAGRIVVAGSVQRSNTGDYDFGVTRLTTSGNLDTMFGSGGKRTIPFDLGGGKSDRAAGVAIDSSNRIVVAGTTQRNNTGDSDFGVTRLTSSGSLDTSFGSSGKRTVAFDLGGTNNDQAASVVIDRSGRIVVGGTVQRNNNGDSDFGVTRLTSSGNLDTTFGSGGKRTVAFDLGGSNYDEAASVVIDSAGRIVVAGSVQRSNTGDYDFGVTRLTTSGNLDTMFGSGGKRTIPFDLGGGKSDRAAGVAIDSRGRIVVAGKAQRNNTDDYDFAVARLLG